MGTSISNNIEGLTMGTSISNSLHNNQMVDHLKATRYVRSDTVEKILRLVDRGHFHVTGRKADWPYRDLAWQYLYLHLSAPSMYGEVLEALEFRNGLSFLNLGSGTGYLNTIAGVILGAHGVNHGVELSEQAVAYATHRVRAFMTFHEHALDQVDFCKPEFLVGDCLQLDPDHQQYDRVYCGSSLTRDDEVYLKNLLKVKGVMVVPYSNTLMQITRTGQNEYVEHELQSVSFNSMTRLSNDDEQRLKFDKPEFPTLQSLARVVIRAQIRAHCGPPPDSYFQCVKGCLRVPIPCMRRPNEPPVSPIERHTITPNVRVEEVLFGTSGSRLHMAMRQAARQTFGSNHPLFVDPYYMLIDDGDWPFSYDYRAIQERMFRNHVFQQRALPIRVLPEIEEAAAAADDNEPPPPQPTPFRVAIDTLPIPPPLKKYLKYEPPQAVRMDNAALLQLLPLE